MAQYKEKLGKTVTKRKLPTIYNSGSVGSVAPYSVVTASEIVPDSNPNKDPNLTSATWLHLTDGTYVNYNYPPNGLRFDEVDVPSEDDPVIRVILVHSSGAQENFIPEG